CSRDVFALARKLVSINTPLFEGRITPRADHESSFPIAAAGFDRDDDEASWIIDDIRRDVADNKLAWGDIALLYRTHEIGNTLETAFLTAGIPCRLAHGRALTEDPVVAYVVAALRVIANPN